MLPFTKRPGRDDTSDVVPKDELPKSSPASVPPPSMVKRSVPPPAPPPAAMSSTHSSIKQNFRPPPKDSIGEDEMTGILQSRSFTGPILPIPAAGRPADATGPHRPNIRPAAGGPASLRSPPPGSTASAMDHRERGRLANQADDDAEDEDDGRTVVRGAPKIVKRTAKKNLAGGAPSSISPAAVIKATLESARQNNARNNNRDRDLTGPNNIDVLMAGPPRDLLEDSDDLRAEQQHHQQAHSQRNPNAASAFARTAHQQQQPAHFQQPPTQQFGGFGFEGPPSHGPPPISVEGPPSYPPSSNAFNPPPSSHPGMLGMHQSNVGVRAEQPQSHYPQPAYGQAPVAPQSVPGVAPSMPAHFMTPAAAPGYAADPPGTAVTSGHRVAGRPAISWAAALLACGLFVGVAAVAVMQNSDSVADTTASFVDPSRAPSKAQGGGGAPQGAPPQTIPVDQNGAPTPQPQPVAPTGIVVGASPTTVGTPVVATPPPGGVVMTGFAPVPVTTTNVAPSPPAKAEKPEKPAAAAPKWKAPAAAPRPAVAKADKGEDDPPPKPAKAEKPEKPEKTAKGDKKGSSSDDAETKKALDALQKAQLESASSFGGKE